MEGFDFDNILIDEKSNKSILVYGISYKTLFGSKPMCIRFDEVNEFIRIYDGIRYLVLFAHQKCHAICNKIKYLIGQKNGITYVFSHNCRKINSYDSLPP